MPSTVLVRDETTAGHRSDGVELTFPTEVITVRELIRERVYQEVDDYNRRAERGEAVFRGLVQPSDAEKTLNGFKPRGGRRIDWKEQFERACAAYESCRVLVLAGDRQTESLEERITLSRGVEVTFLKLVPLVGG
ncbi:MAG: hypothetical protein JNL50_14210 [Phycisphaerae bacterium]|nr:hypothetical protein [Phycisphaerae bacterium]